MALQWLPTRSKSIHLELINDSTVDWDSKFQFSCLVDIDSLVDFLLGPGFLLEEIFSLFHSLIGDRISEVRWRWSVSDRVFFLQNSLFICFFFNDRRPHDVRARHHNRTPMRIHRRAGRRRCDRWTGGGDAGDADRFGVDANASASRRRLNSVAKASTTDEKELKREKKEFREREREREHGNPWKCNQFPLYLFLFGWCWGRGGGCHRNGNWLLQTKCKFN